MVSTPLLVDPAVSRTKFERELAEYRKHEEEHQRRGWWMLAAEYPEVFVIFGTPQLKPPVVVFGALLNFENYDLWAPSVRLVDPFTRQPYKGKELPSVLPRRVTRQMPPEVAALHGLPPGQVAMMQQDEQLMQFHDPDDVPFLCLAGVREYHEHPAHTGDAWLLHRGRGEGTLFFLLDVLWRYGVRPISRFNVQLEPRVGLAWQVAE